MTDKEWKDQISNETNQGLLDKLILFGCDMYYVDLWEATIRELCKRLDVDFEQLGEW